MSWNERAAARAQLAPAWLRALAIVPLAATVYWAVTYSGPYRWLAELQIHYLDGVRPILTGVLLGALSVMPLAGLVQLVGGIRLARAGASAGTRDASAEKTIAMLEWMNGRFYRLVAAALSLGLVVIGAFLAASGWTAGDQVTVEVAALERGSAPEGRYVALVGDALVDHRVTVRRGRNGLERAYIPVVSDAARAGTQPVRAYLEIDELDVHTHALPLSGRKHEGVLTVGGLPNVAVTSFADTGSPAPAEHWVVEYGASPSAQKELGFGLLAGGAFWCFVTAIVWLRIERKKRAAAND